VFEPVFNVIKSRKDYHDEYYIRKIKNRALPLKVRWAKIAVFPLSRSKQLINRSRRLEDILRKLGAIHSKTVFIG